MNDDSEKVFLEEFRKLIILFSNEKIQGEQKKSSRIDTFSELQSMLTVANGYIQRYDSSENETSEEFREAIRLFIKILEETTFKNGLIPYDKITECIFDNVEEVSFDFTEVLRDYGDYYFNRKEAPNDILQQNISAYYKIIRHIDLALIQKDKIINLNVPQLEEMKLEYSKLQDELIEMRNQYNELKLEANKQYKSMLTQFISILGIFAAILMGAFGALQGFTSLFNNAHELSISKLLIISSIGAASVILILFFLLNGIAKLTGRSLSSSRRRNSSIIEKHPTIVITFGVIILLSLVGAALELSNMPLQFAWQGLWWLIPLLWITYMIFVAVKKDFLFFIKRETKKDISVIIKDDDVHFI